MINNTETDLSQILAGCHREDRNCQQALYKLYYAYGMSVCFRYVTTEREAQTILNDGFLKVFKHIKKFDARQRFKPWLRKILINTALDHIKKQRRFKTEVSMDEARNISDQEDILSRIGYKELMAMVQSLSTAYRTVFNLYVIDGYKHEEIAKQLGITVSTSKSNLARAREKLRDMVQRKLNTNYV